MQVDSFTHLYALILRPDLSYEVKVDSQVIESGSIEYDWNLTSVRKTEEPVPVSEDWEQAKDDKAQVGVLLNGFGKCTSRVRTAWKHLATERWRHHSGELLTIPALPRARLLGPATQLHISTDCEGALGYSRWKQVGFFFFNF